MKKNVIGSIFVCDFNYFFILLKNVSCNDINKRNLAIMASTESIFNEILTIALNTK